MCARGAGEKELLEQGDEKAPVGNSLSTKRGVTYEQLHVPFLHQPPSFAPALQCALRSPWFRGIRAQPSWHLGLGIGRGSMSPGLSGGEKKVEEPAELGEILVILFPG